jgi:capsular exopolysaccharide synthesis family protein
MTASTGAIRQTDRSAVERLVELPVAAEPDLRPAQPVKTIECRIEPRRHVLLPGNGQTPGMERFQILRHRLQQLRKKRPLRTLLVTSSAPQDGKTLVAVNLAVVLASQSNRVLLVDADLHTSAVREVLGVEQQPGLAEALEGREELGSLLRFVERLNLHYLPAGTYQTNPTELLQGARLKTALDELASSFEWVVVDSPPLALFADPVSLSALVDATLLVVRCDSTPKESVRDAVAALEGAFLAGIVLNACDSPTDASRYAGYRRYSAAGENASR